VKKDWKQKIGSQCCHGGWSQPSKEAHFVRTKLGRLWSNFGDSTINMFDWTKNPTIVPKSEFLQVANFHRKVQGRADFCVFCLALKKPAKMSVGSIDLFNHPKMLARGKV